MEDYKSEKSILDHLTKLNINPKILDNPTAKAIIIGIIQNRINSLLASNAGINEIENMYNNDIYVDFNGNFSFQDFYRGVEASGMEVSKNYSTNIEINDNGETVIDNSERKYDITLDNVGSEQFKHNSRSEIKIVQDSNFIDIAREDTKVDKDFNKIVKIIRRNNDYVTGTLEESMGNENTNKMNAPETSKIIIMANKNDPKKIGAYIRFEKVTEQIYELMTKQQNELINAVPGLKVSPVPEIEKIEAVEPKPEPKAPAEVPAPAPEPKVDTEPIVPAPEPEPEMKLDKEPEAQALEEEPKLEIASKPVEPETKEVAEPVAPPKEEEPKVEETKQEKNVDELEPLFEEDTVKVETPKAPEIDLSEVREEKDEETISSDVVAPKLPDFSVEEEKEEDTTTSNADVDGMSIEDLIALTEANKKSLDKINEDETRIKEEVKAKKAKLIAKVISGKEEIEKKSSNLESMKSDIEKLNEALGE